MSPSTLSNRALNRALLARQFLLEPVPVPAADSAAARAARVIETVEHLGGLQAQAPFPPYYGLWSRLVDFRPDELATLLTGRQVVRIALMRGTIHLVSARDALALRPLLEPVLKRGLSGAFSRQLAGVDLAALAAAGRELVEQEALTFSELGARLAERWPGSPPNALAQGVRALVPLIQVPPRAVWGRTGQARHVPVETWLDRKPGGGTLDDLVLRYLAAFGPATVADVQAWSGLTRLREVTDRLAPALRRFTGPGGAELFDLPDAPRPDPETPAPVRLVAEFDNLILSHADRSRVLSEAGRARIFTPNGQFPGIVLAGGLVAGMWRITRARQAVTLTVEAFGSFGPADRAAIAD